MPSLLGLTTTEDLATHRFKSVRRKVFYDYPNGAFPLIGLSGMMKEEEAGDPEFLWYEKRMKLAQSLTVANTTGPFGGSGATTPDSWGTTARTGGRVIGTGGAATLNDKISIKIADTTFFRLGHVISIRGLTKTLGGTTHVTARVAGFSGTGAAANPKNENWIDVYILHTDSVGASDGFVNNSATINVGLEVRIVGSSFAQGAIGSSNAAWTLPINPDNYCQIFRSKFGQTGTALKTGLKWDESGDYRDKAKEASIDHMIEMEKAVIFGERSKITSGSDPTAVQYTTGGILWFLKQWELGSLYGNTAATVDSDDTKRIIANSSGDMNEKLYDKYVERIFRVTNNRANEKLCLCGNGFLNVINQMYKSKSVLDGGMPLTATYGMDVVRHRSPFGTLFYKTHPLFNQSATLRFSALFVDTGNMVYRYVIGRDTDLLTNRQGNDEDKRIDEWLTEAGFEIRFPESFMWMENVTDYTP